MIRLQVLGKLEPTESDGSTLDAVLTHNRGVALLVYLALAEPRSFHRRDKRVALLWPELDDTRARLTGEGR